MTRRLPKRKMVMSRATHQTLAEALRGVQSLPQCVCAAVRVSFPNRAAVFGEKSTASVAPLLLRSTPLT